MRTTPQARFVVAAAAVTAALWFGALWPRDPDFDATHLLEAWRPFGIVPLAIATAILGVLVVSDRFAESAAGAAAAAYAATVGRVPARLRVPLLVAAMVALFAALTDTSLSGDGIDVVRFTATRADPFTDPLAHLFHVAVRAVTGLDPYETVRWTSIASGAVWVGLAVMTARDAAPEQRPVRAAAVFLLLCAGPAALFFGSIETYAPFFACTLAFLATGLRRLDARGPVWLPPLLVGLAVATHLSGLFLGLAALALLVHETRRGGAKAAAVWCGAFLVPVVATAGALAIAGMHLRGTGAGADQGMFLPLARTATNPQYRYVFLDAEHVLGVLGILFVCGPAAWAVLCAVPRSPDARGDRRFLLAALVPFVALPFVWNLSYTVRRDWDLLVTAGVPLALLAARSCAPLAETRAGAVRIAALALFAFVPFVLAHHGDRAQRRMYAVTVKWALEGTTRDALPVARWARRIEELDPRHVVVRLEDVLARAGPQNEAVYRSVLADEPEDPFALDGLGRLLAAQGRADEAEPMLRRSLVASPRERPRAPARLALAKIMLASGREEAARRQLDRLIREDAEYSGVPDALELLAGIYETRGDPASAETLRAMARRSRR